MCRKKFKKIIIRPLMVILTGLCVIILSAISYMNLTLPNEYKVFQGKELSVSGRVPISVTAMGNDSSNASAQQSSARYDVELKALGIFPIKQASVSVIDETLVKVLGNTFGIKIYTDGVMVVGMDSVDTENGNKTPAADAGLKVGDVIISINGQKVYSNEEVSAIIETSGGHRLLFKITRDGKQSELSLNPLLAYSSGKYKAGLWVRDSSAGIGTTTFYSPATETICGLGHGICDVDTGELLPLNSGELVDAEIISIAKGTSGNPGELRGKFNESRIGKLLLNCETGVYAKTTMPVAADDLLPIALKQEVKVGKAQILATVDQGKPQLYDCIIEKVAHNNSITKNMVIHVTDPALIAKTGGIVQGMSGTPILQNGKLIGAVTHVFVNDSTGGYGIFAENMLSSAKTAETLEKKNVS